MRLIRTRAPGGNVIVAVEDAGHDDVRSVRFVGARERDALDVLVDGWTSEGTVVATDRGVTTAAAGYELLVAPAGEYDTSFGLNLNVLPVAPRRVLAIAGFDDTHELMRAAGCEVVTFPANALCVNCEGGPTCLTRPILRR